MTRAARIAVAAALLLAGTSLARQKAEGRPARRASLSIPASTRPRRARPRRTPTIAWPIRTMAIPIHRAVADPYYRLSDSYYGYSDPYRGLYDFYAVPPYNPGYSYDHVRPGAGDSLAR